MGLQFGTWSGQCLEHLVEDVLTTSLGLHQCLLQNLVAESIALDVHLGSGQALGSTCGLEVHVAQVVLVAEDVREHGILVFTGVLDKTHGNTADGSLEGHTSVHQREAACANGGHRAGTIRLQNVTYHADGVGIVLGNLTLQTAPSEMAVTNLTTTYTALSLGLTCGEGGEVVVKEETHVALVEYIVHQFLIQFGTQCGG